MTLQPISSGGKGEPANQDSVVEVLAGPISQFVLGSLPYTGGIGAVFANLAASKRAAMVDDLLSQFGRAIAALEKDGKEKLDLEFLDSDNFALLIASVVEQVGVDEKHAKLQYLRRFLVNSVRVFRPDLSLIEAYLQMISPLTGTHILLLERMFDRQVFVAASDRLGNARMKDVPVPASDAAAGLKDPTLIQILLSDLVSGGLIADWHELSGEGKRDVEFCVTRTGFALMRFVTGGWSVPPGTNLRD